MKDKRFWFYIAVFGILVAAVLRILMIQVPLERDEGVYAYVGDRVLAGEMPYVDAIESKPPGIFLAYAAILAIGRSVPFIRIALLLWSTLTALLFYILVKGLYGKKVAGVSCAVLALSLTAPAYFGYAGKTEVFMITFIIAAFFLLAKNLTADSLRLDLAAGALLGVAFMFKPVALTEGLPALVLIVFSQVEFRRKILRLLTAGAGFALLFFAVYLFFAAFGAGSDYLFWAYGYNLSYTSEFSLLDRIFTFFFQLKAKGMLVRDWPIWVAAVVALFTLAKKGQDRSQSWFPLAWILSATIGVSASGRYTPHYFIQLLPAVSLLSGLGVKAILDKVESVKAEKEFKRAFAILILSVILIYPTVAQTKLYIAGADLSRMLYGVNPFMEGEEIGKFLADRTDPEDAIFICGTEPQFLIHAKRKSATRFATLYPLGSMHPKAGQWQEEVFKEVVESDPQYIVMMSIVSSMYLDMRAPKILPNLTLDLARNHYVREAVLVAITARETEFITDDFSKLSKGPAILTIYRKADKPSAD